MEGKRKIFGQKELRERVQDAGLCTNCGACVNLCPYSASYRDQTIIIDSCDRKEGRCYAFCPRTPTDLQELRQSLYGESEWIPELGAFRGFYLTRAADPQVRHSAQHGGTVSALVSLALKEGLLDAAVLAQESGDLLPEGVTVREIAEVTTRGRSKFVVSPTVAAFHQLAKSSVEKIGVVATPCQALAFAKMRLRPFPERDGSIGKLKMVIGLFCGWALSWKELKRLLKEKIGDNSILGLDIPPSKHHSMEVHTRKGILEINLDDVLPAVRPSCNYCFDMTAEFSDLSVGAARLPEGWEVARGWNQVIVRTKLGQELLERARSQGALEFREVPAGNLDRLKRASLNKKRTAIKNLAGKSGSTQNLLYLDPLDPMLRGLAD